MARTAAAVAALIVFAGLGIGCPAPRPPPARLPPPPGGRPVGSAAGLTVETLFDHLRADPGYVPRGVSETGPIAVVLVRTSASRPPAIERVVVEHQGSLGFDLALAKRNRVLRPYWLVELASDTDVSWWAAVPDAPKALLEVRRAGPQRGLQAIVRDESGILVPVRLRAFIGKTIRIYVDTPGGPRALPTEAVLVGPVPTPRIRRRSP